MRIIADISLNFQQLDDILDTIAAVQADMVKLQWYSERDLYGEGDDKCKLDIEWMPQILNCCKEHKKQLLCTVFNCDKVHIIDKYVYMHKVASSEITDKNLLNQIKLCRKPTIVSTGGASKAQILQAIELLGGFTSCLMACDVEYPSKRHNIRRMLELKNQFNSFNVGYSDHSLDICTMPILVSHYGATFYEKHVKPNLGHPSYEQHALTISEFNEMVEVMAGRMDRQPVNPHQRVLVNGKWVRKKII